MIENIVFLILFIIVGYFFGCFSTGYLLSKKKGKDIRSEGSGNTGATNALRTMGALGGVITFGGDLLKTFIPTLVVRFVICRLLNFGPEMTYAMTLLIGFSVVLGHNFPFYLKFKGGKGISVSAAVIISSSTNSITGLVMILTFLSLFIVIVALTKYVSLGSLVVVWFIPIYSIIMYKHWQYFAFLIVLSLLFTGLAYYKHRGNIIRLINGNENKISFKHK